MESVQQRILSAWPALDAASPRELLDALRKRLFKAYEDGLLKTAPNEIWRWVQLAQVPPGQKEGQIVGGVKDFRRDPSSARLLRDDGAWIHFTITVRQDGRRPPELVAYDFEIVFPEGHTPGFLRLDLNPPGHENERRELRSHLHPGNDDLQMPAPVMTPPEILDLMLHGLRPRRTDKPRDAL